MSSSSAPSPPTILMGLSGPSSSGKTTLARLLRSVVNLSVSEGGKEYKLSLFVLHEDDFYKVDKEYVFNFLASILFSPSCCVLHPVSLFIQLPSSNLSVTVSL